RLSPGTRRLRRPPSQPPRRDPTGSILFAVPDQPLAVVLEGRRDFICSRTLLAVSSLCSLRARGPRAEALDFALFPPIMIVASPLLYRHHIVFLFPAAVIWLTWAWIEMRTAVFCCAVLLLTLASIGLFFTPVCRARSVQSHSRR
ncbi:MAG: hypothetical protein ABTD50_21840, partial [Polyangiaceae bacterium]